MTSAKVDGLLWWFAWEEADLEHYSVVATKEQHRAKIEEVRLEIFNQFSRAGTCRALLVVKELEESVRGAMH
ncbi:hypothetical protein N7453_009873 [Penicillium expansum]|nr:hypothetical protein N7453_009873 [Penicillium expansum]